jgi:predicted DsbA family dithiol-disulfide isomerase
MEKKFGKSGRLQSVHDNLTRLGADVGLAFAFDKIKRAPNTLDAHRLIRWANSAGAQGKVVDRLFKAYFVEGRDIGDRGVLIDIAQECGLDATLVEKLLAEGADAGLVREEIAQAQAIGVTGVPFFIFAGRLGVPGAQDPSVLVRAMAQARQAMNEPANEAPVA